MEPMDNQNPEPLLQTSKRRNNKAMLLAILLFALVVLGMFAFAYWKQKDTNKEAEAPVVPIDQSEDRYAGITRIEGKHFFIDDVHTIVGEVAVPTPCDLLDVDVIIAESFPEQVTLDFKLNNSAEFCAQVVTTQRFMVTAKVSEDATFKALLNSRVVELNLVEAAPGETPDSFELFIKG